MSILSSACVQLDQAAEAFDEYENNSTYTTCIMEYRFCIVKPRIRKLCVATKFMILTTISRLTFSSIASQQNSHSVPNITVQPTLTQTENSWMNCLPSASKINNLCNALVSVTQHPSSTCCIGVLDDKNLQYHIHSITLPTPTTASITLRDLLVNHTPTGFHVKEKYVLHPFLCFNFIYCYYKYMGIEHGVLITLCNTASFTLYNEFCTQMLTRNRCSLALTLASAVLHLHGTSWLAETWSMNDIHIMGRTSLLSDQPYLSKNFIPSTNVPSAGITGPKLRIIKNSMIFGLGVALLEIAYGSPLSTFETADDLDHGTRLDWTDYLIADRLTNGLSARELPNYANATRRCIHCNFDSSVYSLNNNDFRERFYQGVIVPLQEDYNYAMGVSGKP
jgi:hypothetical protein